MTAALRYEWRRLWTIRSTYWLIATTLGLQAVLTFLVAWGISSEGEIEGAAEEVMSAVVTLGASFGRSPLFTAYFIAMFGVLTFGHEYRYGMIRATLTAVPDRTAVFVAKAALTVLVAAGLSLLCSLIGMFWSWVFISETADAVGSGEVWGVVVGATLYTVLFALWALGVTCLVRNQTGALALVLLVPLVVENVLRIILQVLSTLGDNNLDEIAKVFPFDAGAQMFVGSGLAEALNEVLGYEPLSGVGGGLVMLGFVAALLAAAYALFLSRDA
jgi:ABC-type transport system involved in multi-copper enzyme maturation permease subunit